MMYIDRYSVHNVFVFSFQIIDLNEWEVTPVKCYMQTGNE